MPDSSPDITMDQAVASLQKSLGMSSEVRRIVIVNNANNELFDAASVVMDWMRTLPVETRPLAKFNRLHDAINGVREAHQMGTDRNAK